MLDAPARGHGGNQHEYASHRQNGFVPLPRRTACARRAQAVIQPLCFGRLLRWISRFGEVGRSLSPSRSPEGLGGALIPPTVSDQASAIYYDCGGSELIERDGKEAHFQDLEADPLWRSTDGNPFLGLSVML